MDAKLFITAGKATFTVSNGKGDHRTYRVTRKDADDRYPETYFVKLLTGPDNTSSYTYLGILDAATGGVRLTKNSKFTDDSLPVKVLRWALKKVWAGEPLPAGYAVQHEGKCGRCGRALTVPESIVSGIGPECAKMGAKGSAPRYLAPMQVEQMCSSDGTVIQQKVNGRWVDGETPERFYTPATLTSGDYVDF